MVDIRDLTVENYILPDIGTFEKEQPVISAGVDVGLPELSSTHPDSEASAADGRPVSSHHIKPFTDMDSEAEDVEEDEQERERQREHVLNTLKRRPQRFSRGFWREAWSFVV